MAGLPALLLVDFGASRVKSALWSRDAGAIVAVRECAAPPLRLGANGEAENDAEAYWQALDATAGALLRESGAVEVDSLWLCTEMHGCVIAAGDADPATLPYISWRDERASRAPAGAAGDTGATASGATTYARLQAHGEAIFAASGMRLRPGLPLLTLTHLQREGKLAARNRLYTLADWLLWRGGAQDPAIHASLAAGTALYDRAGAWSPVLAALAGLDLDQLTLPRVLPAGAELGRITLGGRELSVRGALGDLQAAVYGAGFPAQASLIINLGTGSQVLRQSDRLPAQVESRPGPDGGQFGAITHIPSGRALNVFAGFLDGCAQAGGGQPFFWQRFAALSTEQVLAAPASIDLKVFEAAWRYGGGGAISAIHEGRFSVDEMLAALAHSWLAQYADAVTLLDPDQQEPRFLLAGGLSRRAAFILPVLEALTGRCGIAAASATGEETLDGLLALALHHDHAA